MTTKAIGKLEDGSDDPCFDCAKSDTPSCGDCEDYCDYQKKKPSPTVVKFPEFYLESKYAYIKAHREDDFHYAWVVGDNQLLIVEYIPMNWPCLRVSIGPETVEKMKATLREIGFEIEDE